MNEAVGEERTTEFNLEDTFHLCENLYVRDGLARLVILKHGGLLVDLLCEILLCELELETCCGDGLHGRVSGKFEQRPRVLTFPTLGATLGGGATSLSRSSLAMRWWSGPSNCGMRRVYRSREVADKPAAAACALFAPVVFLSVATTAPVRRAW